jgi:hypothetical protein
MEKMQESPEGLPVRIQPDLAEYGYQSSPSMHDGDPDAAFDELFSGFPVSPRSDTCRSSCGWAEGFRSLFEDSVPAASMVAGNQGCDALEESHDGADREGNNSQCSAGSHAESMCDTTRLEQIDQLQKYDPFVPSDHGGEANARTQRYTQFVRSFVLPTWDKHRQFRQSRDQPPGFDFPAPCNKTGQPKLYRIPVLYIKSGYPNRDLAKSLLDQGLGMVIIDNTSTTWQPPDGGKENRVELGGPKSGSKKHIGDRMVLRVGGSYKAEPGQDKVLKMWKITVEEGEEAEPGSADQAAAPSKKRKKSAGEGNNTGDFSLCYWVYTDAAEDKSPAESPNQGDGSSTEALSGSHAIKAGQVQEKACQDFVNEWAPVLRECLVCAVYVCSTLCVICMYAMYLA